MRVPATPNATIAVDMPPPATAHPAELPARRAMRLPTAVAATK